MIIPLPFQEFLMTSLLHNFSFIDRYDNIGIPDSIESAGYNETGPALEMKRS